MVIPLLQYGFKEYDSARRKTVYYPYEPTCFRPNKINAPDVRYNFDAGYTQYDVKRIHHSLEYIRVQFFASEYPYPERRDGKRARKNDGVHKKLTTDESLAVGLNTIVVPTATAKEGPASIIGC